MILSFEASGNLPPGVHAATWDEFVARYGSTPHRLALLAGLKAALDASRTAGCERTYLDGSFVTAKAVPGDFDGCWEVAGVDPDLLDPVLLVFANQRAAQKAKYGGEFFPAETAGTRFLDFFQRDKQTGDPKGIIALDIGGLP